MNDKLYVEVSNFLNIFNFNIVKEKDKYMIEDSSSNVVGVIQCFDDYNVQGKIYIDDFYMEFMSIIYKDNNKPFSCIINYNVNNNEFYMRGKNVIKNDYKTGKRIVTSSAKTDNSGISFSSIYNEFNVFSNRDVVNYREESFNHNMKGKVFKIKQKDDLVIYHNISRVLDKNIDGVFDVSNMNSYELSFELEDLLNEYDNEYYTLVEIVKSNFDSISDDFCNNLYKYSLSDDYKEKLGWLLDKSFDSKDSKVKTLKNNI